MKMVGDYTGSMGCLSISDEETWEEKNCFRRKRTKGRFLLNEVCKSYGSIIRFRSMPAASAVLRLTNLGSAMALLAGSEDNHPKTSMP